MCFRSEVDDFVSAETAILLQFSGESTDLYIETLPNYPIKILSFVVSNCNKIEIYVDQLQEYLKTIYGELLDEVEDIKTYRFDLNLEKLATKVHLKFVTKSNDIWIYGMSLKVINNLPMDSQASINMANVQQMLSDTNLSDNAKKCQNFLQSYIASNPQRMTQQVQQQTNVISDIVSDVIGETIKKEFGKIFNEEIAKFIAANQGSSAQTHDAPTLPPDRNFSLQSMLDNLPAPRGVPDYNELMRQAEQCSKSASVQSKPIDQTSPASPINDLSPTSDPALKEFINDQMNLLQQNINGRLDDIERVQDDKFNEILRKLDEFNAAN